MKNTKHIKTQHMTQKKFIKPILLVLAFVCSTLFSHGQLVERAAMEFSGQYDVKMISSQVMQLAWISSADGDPYEIIRPCTTVEMDGVLKNLAINNNVCGATENSVVDFSEDGYTAIKPATATGVAMVYADCDDDMTTFQSSACYLDFGEEYACTTVEAAYLYWNSHDAGVGESNYAAGDDAVLTNKSHAAHSNGGIDGTAYQTVKFKAPGDAAYTDVTMDRQIDDGTGERKVCFADVTTLVQGKPGGLYWVGNVRSSSAKGSGGVSAGWTLVVVYKPPNCPPRTIKFWDGLLAISGGSDADIDFSFNAGDVPATGNSVSYLGIAVLDGENIASYLAESGDDPEFIEFTSTDGSTTGTTFKINPFATGQTLPNAGEPQDPIAVYDKDGVFLGDYYEGVSCSRMSTYDKDLQTNGNELSRLPYQRNTLGYDAHHLKLPVGALIADATDATMTYYAGPQGGTSPFMAYMAIETLQPRLILNKTVDQDLVALEGTLTYTLTIVNKGGAASRENINTFIVDSLDTPIDYVSGSIEYTDKDGNVISDTWASTAPVVTGEGTDDEYIEFYLPSIAAADATTGEATDSVTITFQVQVEDISRMDIWNSGCRRTIQNMATIFYDTDEGLYLESESNTENGCGGGDAYASSYVDDVTLDAHIDSTHNFYTNLRDELTADPNLKIVDVVRSCLVDSTAQFDDDSVTTAEAALFSVTDMDGNEIDATAEFDLTQIEQTYLATMDVGTDGYECYETYTFTYLVAKIPDMVTVATDPKCAETATGSITATFTNGGSGFGATLVNASAPNTVIFTSSTASGETDDEYTMGYLEAGTYYVYKDVLGEIFETDTLTLTDPAPLVMTITPSSDLTVINDSVGEICRNTAFTLTQDVGALTGLDYVWKSSTDSITWTTLAETSYELDVTGVADTTYYLAYACNSICSIKQPYTVRPVQVIDFPDLTDTICSGGGFTIAPYDSITAPAMTPTTLTYSWIAPVVAGVTGLAAGTDATDISATLVNGNSTPVDVVYTVTPTIDGCEGASFDITIALDAPVTVLTTDQTAICVDSVVDLTDSVVFVGSTDSLTYEYYSDAALLVSVVDPTAVATAGTYYLKGTSSYGCSNSASVDVAIPTQTEFTVSSTDPDCYDGTGVIEFVTVSGGTLGTGYTYSLDSLAPWTTFTVGTQITSLVDSTYTIRVLDGNGCPAENKTATITVPYTVKATGGLVNPICSGGTGKVGLTISGGTGTYEYDLNSSGSWTTIASGDTVYSIPEGGYTIDVRDSKLCTAFASVTGTVVVPSAVTVSGTAENPLCYDGTGILPLTISGGTGGTYEYKLDTDSWVEAIDGDTIFNLSGGSHDVYVRDSNLCVSSVLTQSVTIPTQPEFTISSTDPNCYNETGVIEFTTVSGGSGSGYEYTLEADSTTSLTSFAAADQITGLVDSTYTIHVVDANGCFARDTSVTISIPDTVKATGGLVNPICSGGTGKVGLTISGGTGTYEYDLNSSGSWTTIASGDTVYSVPEGGYTIDVRDSKLCTAFASVTGTVVVPSVVTVSGTAENPSCYDGTGILPLTISGGTGGTYEYKLDTDAWVEAVDGDTIFNLSGGSHDVYVRDSNLCVSSVLTQSVTIPTQPEFTVSSTDPNCYNETGVIEFTTVSGGSGSSYEYTLEADSTSFTSFVATDQITGLVDSTYTIHVVDANGCFARDTSVTITVPDSISATLSKVDVSSFGAGDGSVVLSLLTGGNGDALEYYLSGVETFSTSAVTRSYGDLATILSNLAGGTYTIKARNVGQTCASTLGTIFIKESGSITGSITVDSVDCYGTSTGAIHVDSIEGGTPGGYTYQLEKKDAGGTYVVYTAYTSGSIDTSYVFENLPVGIYQVKVTDASATPIESLIDSEIEIFEPDSLVATISNSRNLTCYTSTNGSAKVAVTGGTETYSYLWDDASAQTGSVATNLLADDYIVTVTDLKGCTDTAMVTITRPDSLNATIGSYKNVSCQGDSTGTATVVVTGGSVSSSYSFLWDDSSAQTDSIAIDLAADTYKVIVTDDSLCIDSAFVTISEPTKLVASVTSQENVKCHGGSTGSVDVTVIGGTPSVLTGYSYSWDNGQTVEDATGLVAGTYVLTVTDSLSCTDTTELVITQPDTLTVDVVEIINVDCKGASTGSIRAIATGGTGSISYVWDDTSAQADSFAITLPAAIYTVTATDANSCVATASDTIKEPTQPVFTAVRSEQYCYGETGAIELSSVSEGTVGTGYQYSIEGDSTSWTSFVAGDSIKNLVDSTYTVHVIDGNGCYAADTTITIDVPDSISATLINKDITVAGSSDGAVICTYLVGGDSINPVEFRIVGTTTDLVSVDEGFGDSTTVLKGLAAGTYTVYARNETRTCDFELGEVTISAPDAIKARAKITKSIPCHGDSLATLYVDSVVGGVAGGYYYQLEQEVSGVYSPYSGYEYKSIATTDTFTTFINLPAGVYRVRAKDTNGILNEAIVANITIYQPDSLVAVISKSRNLTCYASTNGSAEVAVTGGTQQVSGFDYLWDDTSAQTDSVASGLLAGDYVVTVTDLNSCTDTAMVTITRPDSLNATIGSYANVSCQGDSTGTATVVVAGGSVSSSYSFLWDDSSAQTDSIAIDLAADTYKVIVTDDSLCIDSAFVTISEPTKLVASVTSQENVKCHGGSTGSVDVTVNGGTPSVLTGYSYSWDNGQTVEDATGLAVGTYTLTVTDSLSCTDTTEVVITEPDTLTVAIGSITDVKCNGLSTGEMNASATGGSGTISYKWNDASSQVGTQAINLSAGIYTVTVTDDNLCTATAKDTIKEPTALVRTVTAAAAICSTGTSKIYLNVSGGTANANGKYLYSVDSGSLTEFADGDSITGLVHGSYTVSVKDANDCTVSDTTVDVEVYAPATISLVSGSDDAQVLCASNTTISSIVYKFGGGVNGATVTGLESAGLNTPSVDYSDSTITISGTFSSNSANTYNYTVETTGAASTCENVSLTGSMKVVDLPTISSVTGAEHCGPAALTLKATTPGGTINWYDVNTGGTSLATGTSYTTPVLSTTKNYYVEVVAGDCKSSRDSIAVATINEAPTLTVTSATAANLNQEICSTRSTSTLGIKNVSYTFGGGATGVVISAKPSDIDTITSGSIFSISGKAASSFNYIVTTTGQQGSCKAVSLNDTVTIHEVATLVLTSVLPDREFCSNETMDAIKYSVGGGYTGVDVQGLPSGVTSSLSNDVVTINAASSMVADGVAYSYTVKVEQNAVCSTPDLSGTIRKRDIPSVEILDVNSTCPGEDVLFEADSDPSVTTYDWTIMKNGVSFVENIPGTSTYTIIGAKASDADVFKATVQVSDGYCSSEASASIRVRTAPVAPIVTNKSNCEAIGSIEWNSLISTRYSDVNWYSEGILLDTVPDDIDKSITGTSVYGVNVTDSYGCMSDTSYVSYTVLENPVITSVDQSDLTNIQLTVTKGTEPYSYTVGNQSDYTYDGTISLGTLSFGIHELFIQDSNECSTSTTFEIDAIELEPSKYFTPNGDGQNDYWEVGNLELYPNTEIYIHDRFGKEIAKYNGKDFKGWDGTYMGNPLPGTDYWYVIYVRETGKRIVGHFLLKR